MTQVFTSPGVSHPPPAPSKAERGWRVRPINVNKGLLLLRLVIGFLFIGHGCQKLFGWFGGPGMQGWIESLARNGLEPASFWAYTAAVAELSSGVLLVIGLLTPLAAAALIGDMLVAILDVHASKGLWSQNGGFEYNLVLIALLFAMGWTGPGAYALDRRLPAWPRPHAFIGCLAITLLIVAFVTVPRHLGST